MFIGEVCEEENIEDENLEFKFGVDIKNYNNYEEKLNFIQRLFLLIISSVLERGRKSHKFDIVVFLFEF